MWGVLQQQAFPQKKLLQFTATEWFHSPAELWIHSRTWIPVQARPKPSTQACGTAIARSQTATSVDVLVFVRCADSLQ